MLKDILKNFSIRKYPIVAFDSTSLGVTLFLIFFVENDLNGLSITIEYIFGVFSENCAIFFLSIISFHCEIHFHWQLVLLSIVFAGVKLRPQICKMIGFDIIINIFIFDEVAPKSIGEFSGGGSVIYRKCFLLNREIEIKVKRTLDQISYLTWLVKVSRSVKRWILIVHLKIFV